MRPILAGFSNFILDLDGVMYRGKTPRAGAAEILAELRRRALSFHFLTNTSVKTSDDIATQLRQMGLDVTRDQITTASEVAAAFVAGQMRSAEGLYTIGGGAGLPHALARVGLNPTRLEDMTEEQTRSAGQASTAVTLLIGWSRSFGYSEATKILALRRRVTHVYATDDDVAYIEADGLYPGTAWVYAVARRLLSCDAKVLGKPSKWAASYVLQKVGATAGNTLVVGDSIESDVALGKGSGCSTCLVLGGSTSVSDLEALPASSHPNFVVSELTELMSATAHQGESGRHEPVQEREVRRDGTHNAEALS